MGRLSRFQAMQHAKNLITKHFKELDPKAVLSYTDIEKTLKDNREKWLLPKVTRTKDFIKFLKDNDIINEEIDIDTPMGQVSKYTVDDLSNYKIALSLRDDSYLSHYTAVYLHELTDNIPKNIFANKEQSKKPGSKGDLEQDRIDMAFSRTMRKTNQIASFKEQKVYLINGKNVERIGVIDDFKINEETLSITSIERTLIDAAVRPGYAGGVHEVLGAYKKAKEKVSVNRLLAMLKKMNYTYPYQQAIGFYMERAGYKENLLKLVEKMRSEYKFYLTYDMREKTYDKRWQLFYPERLN